jgi:hypothetical protein
VFIVGEYVQPTPVRVGETIDKEIEMEHRLWWVEWDNEDGEWIIVPHLYPTPEGRTAEALYGSRARPDSMERRFATESEAIRCLISLLQHQRDQISEQIAELEARQG